MLLQVVSDDDDLIPAKLERDFATIFGAPVFVAASTAQEEENLDPASQTGDFVLPRDREDVARLEQAVAEMQEIVALADRIVAGTATEADKERLRELQQPEEIDLAAAIEEAEALYDAADDFYDEGDLFEAIVGESIGGDVEVEIEDLTPLEMLVYHYADGRELEVLHPVSLSVRFDGAEQITCSDRVGIVAPAGYLKCERFPKFGEACFSGHDPVHTLGDDEAE